jgi:DNA-binding FrmR family transcriptional regulator
MIEKTRKKALNDRLNRIQGQIEGLRKMIGEERSCLEILAQISSVNEALRGVGKIMLRNYLESCATRAIRSRDKRKAEETYNDLMEVIYKFTR